METIENLILLAIVLLIGYNFFAGIHESYRNYNRVHFYVARDKDGSLWLYIGKPIRSESVFASELNIGFTKYNFHILGLNENDYADLKWEDEPVEVFINMED